VLVGQAHTAIPVHATIDAMMASAGDTMALGNSTPPAPVRNVEPVEETVFIVLDSIRDQSLRQWIFNTGSSNHMTEAH
jgi:hypothetical protein